MNSKEQSMRLIIETANAVEEMLKTFDGRPDIDQRWVAIAKTDIQKGFLGITKAVGRPGDFL